MMYGSQMAGGLDELKDVYSTLVFNRTRDPQRIAHVRIESSSAVRNRHLQ